MVLIRYQKVYWDKTISTGGIEMFIQDDLSIKSMTVSQIYDLFLNGRLIVNRKYQRKLCWSIEEKRNFMDTIMKGLPVPMLLLASTEPGNYEIIDGMQRLDAICTYVGQKYNLKDGYFNLESMPDTIEQKRIGNITQRTPILDSTICKAIANYPIPVSIFPASNDGDVEEIFKRINSTGKHLSHQELRQVGVSTKFATLVRRLSSEIRGDVSEDILLLRNMTNISLSNYRLYYSINISDIFWVKNGIINQSEIRQSRDEEAIAFIIANMILPPDERKPILNKTMLDNLYGYSRNPLNTEVPVEITQISNAIDRACYDNITKQFSIVMSCIKEMITASHTTFRALTGISKETSDLIDQFQIVFMAVHRLVIKEKRQKVDYCRFANFFASNGNPILAHSRRDNRKRENDINAFYGLIEKAFESSGKEDPAIDDWTLEFENILNKSRTEQNLYDFKIGFVPYKGTTIDSAVIEKVLKTLTAINNIGPNKVGYVIVGVADNQKDAQKYADLYGFKYETLNDLALCGIDHDASALGMSMDRYTHTIKEKIKGNAQIPEAYRQHILTQMKVLTIYGNHMFVFKTCYSDVVMFGDDYFLREFSDVKKLEKSEYPSMFANYYKK